MNENRKTKCTRCKMGLPIGITIALIGLAGLIAGIINYDTVRISGLIPYVALLLIGPPFARMALLVNGSHARIDKLEESIKE